MEWVETTARTVDEAKELALDRLGVTADEAEFEVVEEPRTGLFGRLRGEARVRARIRPTNVRPKQERRDRRKKTDRPDQPAARAERSKDDAPAKDTPSNERGDRDRNERGDRGERPRQGSPKPQARPRQENKRMNDDRRPRPQGDDEPVDPTAVAAAAEEFLVGLTSAFGLSATTESSVAGDDIDVRVHGSDLGLLVGPKGNTLAAIQDVVRVASQRKLGDHQTHLRIDIADYRERRRVALSKFAHKMADEVRESGTARVLEPMPSADRKVIHDTIMEIDGVSSRSQGDDPYRRVVIELG